MSSQAEPDAIQLHFCQRCGISIPQADIDTGRARAAPGGYVCGGCWFPRSDAAGPAPAAAGRAGAISEPGGRLLVTIALL
jgi:hypothetical protein